METYIRAIIIVAVSEVSAANAALYDLAGGDPFGSPLTTLADPLTVSHLFCEWQLTEADHASAQAALSGIAHAWYDRDNSDPEIGLPTVNQVLELEGLARYAVED